MCIRDRSIAESVSEDLVCCRSMTWDPAFMSIPMGEYMSMKKQVEIFKYLIDMEGVGYSPRLKLQFFSFRPLFIVDRPWQEFFFEHLKPWIHYVPVSRDLSDLLDNLHRVRSDAALQNTLIENMCDFAQIHLTKANALQIYSNIFKKHS